MSPFAALLNLFVPKVCHLCECNLVGKEEFICTQCAAKLPNTGFERYAGMNPMEERFAGQLPLGRACAPYFYTRDSKLASLVHDFKYHGFSRLATHLGAMGANELADSGLFNGIDILLPVPLHWRKEWKRGYNQSEMIARGISKVTGIPIGRELKASKAHRTQTSLTSEQRIANTKGIFRIEHPETLKGKHVMLVDDICTTGATLLSAGETLAASTEHDIIISIFTLGTVS